MFKNKYKFKYMKKENYIKKQSNLYNNILFVSQDDIPMFYCSYKKAKFYLNKHLAIWKTVNPPVIKFVCQTNGLGKHGDKFHLTERINRCVVCGEYDKLHKFHIVPKYIKRLYNDKSRTSHDVVLLCEKHSFKVGKFQQKLEKELNILTSLPLDNHCRELISLLKSIHVLKNNNENYKIDDSEKKRHYLNFENYFGYNYGENTGYELQCIKLSLDVLEKNRKALIKSKNTKRITSNPLDETAVICRSIFMKLFSPKFMPEHWDIYANEYDKKTILDN